MEELVPTAITIVSSTLLGALTLLLAVQIAALVLLPRARSGKSADGSAAASRGIPITLLLAGAAIAGVRFSGIELQVPQAVIGFGVGYVLALLQFLAGFAAEQRPPSAESSGGAVRAGAGPVALAKPAVAGLFLPIFVASALAVLAGTGADAMASRLAPPSAGPSPTSETVVLDVFRNGAGLVLSDDKTIDCGSICRGGYGLGRQIVLTATAADDTVFVGWDGDCKGSGKCELTLDRAHRVTAIFDLPSLTITVAGKGRGIVHGTTEGLDCPALNCKFAAKKGTTTVLTATSHFGSMLTGWGVSTCPPTSRTCRITLDASKSLSVSFDPVPSLPGDLARYCDTTDAKVSKTAAVGQPLQLTACFQRAGGVRWIEKTPTDVLLVSCCPLEPSQPVYTPAAPEVSVVAPSTEVVRFSFEIVFNEPGELVVEAMLVHQNGAPVPGGTVTFLISVRERQQVR